MFDALRRAFASSKIDCLCEQIRFYLRAKGDEDTPRHILDSLRTIGDILDSNDVFDDRTKNNLFSVLNEVVESNHPDPDLRSEVRYAAYWASRNGRAGDSALRVLKKFRPLDEREENRLISSIYSAAFNNPSAIPEAIGVLSGDDGLANRSEGSQILVIVHVLDLIKCFPDHTVDSAKGFFYGIDWVALKPKAAERMVSGMLDLPKHFPTGLVRTIPWSSMSVEAQSAAVRGAVAALSEDNFISPYTVILSLALNPDVDPSARVLALDAMIDENGHSPIGASTMVFETALHMRQDSKFKDPILQQGIDTVLYRLIQQDNLAGSASVSADVLEQAAETCQDTLPESLTRMFHYAANFIRCQQMLERSREEAFPDLMAADGVKPSGMG